LQQRQQFLEIAARRTNEVCASYTVVSLGLQAYVRNRALAATAADTSVPARAPLAEGAPPNEQQQA
jgi:hypothetical protein